MKYMLRSAALLLLLALCLSALFSCRADSLPDGESDSPNPNAPNEPTPEAPLDKDEEPLPSPLDPTNALLLVQDQRTDYVVVLDDAASSTAKRLTTSFCDRFWSKTGANIQTRQDTGASIDKEIIVSLMDGRTQPTQEYAKLTAPQKKGYRISVVEESVIVACEEEYLADALDLLILAISDCGNGMFGIPKDYEGELDIPKIPMNGTLYSVGEGNYAYTVSNATEQMVNTFLADMVRDDFSVYSEHAVGSSRFATYVKDSIYGQMVVYTMYHPEINEFRLTYGPMEYLPNVTPLKADNKADPTITQMFLETAYQSDKMTLSGSTITANDSIAGMSYILQLSDGRFIVIDGGSADCDVRTVKYNASSGKWEVVSDTRRSTDGKRLYDTMNAMKPASHTKPRVAVWFITHAHADHWNLAWNFLNDYKNKIKLETLAFNFPEPNRGNLTTSRQKRINEFKLLAKNTYGADLWVMHTGQVMELPGASIEVLSTVEDYYCEGKADALTKEIDLNNTSATLRVHIGSLSFMVLGDAYATTCRFMSDAYGNALQSDVLQLAHHGFNGATLEVYQAIDPKICLWPTDEFHYRTAPQTMGTAAGYEFNHWLRNNPWKRDGGAQGAREHYTMSYVTTIHAQTGKIVTTQ